jgi:hypothetical protein
MEDWSNIVGILFFLLIAIALPLIFRRRRKGAGAANIEELYQHLRGLGVEASLAKEGDDRAGIGLGRASGQGSEGLIVLEDRSVDSINVVSVSTQYGKRYFIDYLVKSPNIAGERMLRTTRLIRKKSPPIWGKVVAIDWKGDDSLIQSINLDYSLGEKLLRADVNVLKGGIWIFPEPKYGYVRIRTEYSLPSAEIFGVIRSIARRVRSW